MMARLRTIARTGAFSWNSDSGVPLLVTGTRAGAVDVEFSDETKLELWDLNLDNPDKTVELQPITSYSTDSRFHDITWSPPIKNDPNKDNLQKDYPRGIIAGALENGTLLLWDAEKFISKAEDSLISQTEGHTGPIKSLEFNPLKPQILATAGAQGELFIYDINDIANPFRLGATAARTDDLECVSWNRKVPHILATGGSGGFVTVWDLKTKKASLTLNNDRKAVGAIAWDPSNATKLLTATPDDLTPVILLWDLRNSNAPECILKGHSQGILSISWCQQDNKLLLSSGKDSRTILWDPQTGSLLGEFPAATNWTFKTRFHPHNPAISATASFDGKISVHTLYNTNSIPTQPPAHNAADGEDFFSTVQSLPQTASFSLITAPKWLNRPTGVSFGFGGKIVSFSPLPATSVEKRASKIQITQYAIDSDIESTIKAFEEAYQSQDIKKICQHHTSKTISEEERASWKAIEILASENSRNKVAEYLGFSETCSDITGMAGAEKAIAEASTDGTETKDAESSRFSNLFADGTDGDDFLSNLSNMSTKSAKTDNPFHMFSETDSESEKQICQALIFGNFEKAMNICLKEDRIADALIIANNGGKSLFEKAQSSYLSKKIEGPNYLRLLNAIIGKNLWDVVNNADLANWKEAMVTLCTFADPIEYPDLCESLGDRIMERNSPKDASFCYLIGSKLEKVVPIWLSQLEETAKVKIADLCGDSLFSVHARCLQNFIEKVTLFRDVTKFQDTELNLKSGWALTPLYARYIEYADIAAAHGHLKTAERYLDLLPVDYPAADVARSRVKLVSNRPAQIEKREQSLQNLANSKSRPAVANTYEPASYVSPTAPAHPPSSAYMPIAPKFVENPYAPMTNNGVSHQHIYQPSQEATYRAVAANYRTPSPSFMPAARKSAPPVPPPQTKNIGQWNDTPVVVKPSTARRTTPSVTSNNVPMSNQQNISMPPQALPYNSRAVANPPPPPPKGPPNPRLSSPPVAAQQYQGISPSTSQYAPSLAMNAPQTTQPISLPAVVPGISQYNTPPIGSTSNRYSPASTHQSYQAQASTSQIPPPNPSGSKFTYPQNSFTLPEKDLQNQHQPHFSQYENPRKSMINQQSIETDRPPVSMQPRKDIPNRPPSTASVNIPATKLKHPAGDRSHIPSNARRMVEILSEDMNRVSSQAPSSFAPQVKDTQKRLNILFDHLNNEELIKPDTILKLNELAEALVERDYDIATRLQIDIQKEKTDECGNWMVGVKRLISMSKVTS